MKVAVLGPEKTYTDLAYQKYFQHKDNYVFYYPTIYQTLKALDTCDFAIVPIENTLDGYIQPTMDGLLEQHVFIVDEVYIPVQFGFVGNCNDLKDINRLYVQFATKNQCQTFINQLPQVKIIHTESNSETLELGQKLEEGSAAIIPMHVFDEVIGKMRIPNVSDSELNETRFVIVSRTKEQKEADAYRLSIVIKVDNDRPGLLFDVLKIFKEDNINLTSILSRPTKKQMGTYQFFIEMVFDASKINSLDTTIKNIKSQFNVEILGLYPNRKLRLF